MKSKSGSAEHNTIIDLVMVVLVITVLLFVGAAVYKLLTPTSNDFTISKNNMESVVRQLKVIPDGESRQIPVFISPNLFVIGFNEDQTRIESACGMSLKVVIQRPGSCAGRCLCLCSKDDGCAKTSHCRSFEDKFWWKGGNGCELALIPGSEKVQTVTVRKSGSDITLFSIVPKQ